MSLAETTDERRRSAGVRYRGRLGHPIARGLAAALGSLAIIAPALACSEPPRDLPGRGAVHPSATRGTERPLFRFVSMADFLNADIGDVSRLPRWHRGDPNSINLSWQRAMGTILNQVRSEHPAFVLVAGDLVDGRWLRDSIGGQIFGPTATRADRLRVVAAAGRLYYAQYRHRFDVRGLRLLPALGDHDIGNDPWPAGSPKLAAVSVHKQAFANAFTRRDGRYEFSQRPRGTPAAGTSYAVRVTDTLVVTVDEFRRTSTGVRLALERGQLRWLDQVLGEARAEGVAHIIVQGHLPVIDPGYAIGSSRLVLAGGASSAFWRTLQRYHVDLYLAGEFHTTSVITDGVTQVVHGSLTWKGMEDYVLGTVYPDRIVLDFKRFTGGVLDALWLWQYEGQHCSAHLWFAPIPRVVRRYVIGASVFMRTKSRSS